MKLPCIDCITLAMCRQLYLRGIDESENNTNRGYIYLRNKCSLLDQFFKLPSHQGYNEYIGAYRTFTAYIERE